MDFLSFPAVVTLSLLLSLALRNWLSRQTGSNVHKLPVPPGAHWLWGHEKDIFLSPAGARFTEWFSRYGPVLRYKGALSQSDIIGLADMRAIHHLLVDNTYGYMKSPSIRPLIERLVGQGLVWAEGDQHKRMRKILNPVFSSSTIRETSDIVADSVNNVRHALEHLIESQNGESTINLCEYTSSYTLDVICRVGFSHDTHNGTSNEAQEIRAAWGEQVNAGFTIAAFYGQVVIRMLPFIAKLPLSYFEAQGRIKAVVREVSLKLFEQAKVLGLEKDKSLLGTILKANSQLGNDTLSITEVIDSIATFVVAGYETTSSTIGLALLELAKNHIIQERLRQEVLAFSGELNYDNLMNPDIMPYLDAVVKEGLRIHPAGVNTERVAISDDVIPLGNPLITASGEVIKEIHVKAGQIITLPVNSINMQDSVWTDGHSFRPERWIEPGCLPSKKDLLPGGYSNLMTFSEGPRICIGYRLALFELKAFLFTIIRHFVVHDTGARVETKFSGTAQTRVVGREEEGAQLPIRLTIYHRQD